MKKYIINISSFFLVLVLVTTILVVSTSFYTHKNFNFKINENKNILLVGDSHPEYAINDSILKNVFNLAHSGSAYFYDYLKVREIISKNTHIDTVIIGYSYSNLEEKRDAWFSGKDKIKYKLRSYFFLFNNEDYFSLLKSNYKDVLINTPQTIVHNLKMKKKGYKYLGGYKSFNGSKLNEAKEIIALEKPSPILTISQYQSKYLVEIYNYCDKKNITLILINTPIHPMLETILEPHKEKYFSFASENLPKALLINHSNFKLPENCFRDLSHLNSKGAKIYSDFLYSNKFQNN